LAIDPAAVCGSPRGPESSDLPAARPRGAPRSPWLAHGPKGDGLPAARHRRREHIAAVEARWDRRELDPGGMATPEVLQALQQELVELQCGKRHVPLSTGMIRVPFSTLLRRRVSSLRAAQLSRGCPPVWSCARTANSTAFSARTTAEIKLLPARSQR